MKGFLILASITFVTAVQVQANEIENRLRKCMKGSDQDVPIYLSLMPFLDVDTSSSAFMTEHASIIYEDMKQFYLSFNTYLELYLSLKTDLALKVNEAGHSVPQTDRNVLQIIDYISNPVKTEAESYSILEKKFLEPYQSDMIIIAQYRDTQSALDMLLYIVAKSKKRIISSGISFSKLEYFCEQVTPNSRLSKTVLCKNQENISLLIFIKLFWENLCPGLLNRIIDNQEKSQNDTSIQSKTKPNLPPLVYISQLSFIDTNTAFSLNNTSKGKLIDNAVAEGIQKAMLSNAAISFNRPGHHLKNTNTNCNKLINIMFDPNLEKKIKIDKIISDILIPNNIDCILTGQLISKKKKNRNADLIDTKE